MKKSALLQDLSWYALGTFLPMILGLIKTPIFTRHFHPEDYGVLGFVQLSYQYLGLLLFSWLASCLWRYYFKFKEEGRLGDLRKNLGFLFVISMGICVLFTVLWLSIEQRDLTFKLIVYAGLHLGVSQLLMLGWVVVRLEGRSRAYSLFQIIRSALTLVCALWLVFIRKADISALVLSLLLIDAVLLLLSVLFNPKDYSIKDGRLDKKVLKELLVYGSAGLLLNLCVLTMNMSDRYVILGYEDYIKLGSYDQVARIGQLSLAALVAVYFNAVNPELMRLLEQRKANWQRYFSAYVHLFLLLLLPIGLYLCVFSKALATLMLGEAFLVAAGILPWVFSSAFLSGLNNFFELRMKFSGRIRQLAWLALIAALLNLILNLWLVPSFGYTYAAIGTFLSFFMMSLYFFWQDADLSRALGDQLFGNNKSLTFLLMIQLIYFGLKAGFFGLDWRQDSPIALIFVLIYFYQLRSKRESLLP